MAIERIVRGITLTIFLRTIFENGSRSQDEFDDWDCKLVTLSRVAGVKEVKEGGVRW